jgi:hypothetical protein
MPSPGNQLVTIQCPQCGRSLPGGLQHCQFCGASLASVPRPVPVSTRRVPVGPPGYVIGLYYASAIWWILQGIRMIASGFNLIPDVMAGPGAIFAGIVYVAIAVGLFFMALGLGLVLKWEWARGVVNIICWINIFFGILSFFTLFGMAFVFGPIMIVGVILNVIDICISGGMVWLIGETEQWR